MAYLCVSGGVVDAECLTLFNGDKPIKTKKQHFLDNNVNKQKVILLVWIGKLEVAKRYCATFLFCRH